MKLSKELYVVLVVLAVLSGVAAVGATAWLLLEAQDDTVQVFNGMTFEMQARDVSHLYWLALGALFAGIVLTTACATLASLVKQVPSLIEARADDA